MASIFQIGISQNTKCALKDGFRKSSHKLICVGKDPKLTSSSQISVISIACRRIPLV